MPWSRGSLLVALLALHIPFAKADTVIVDTTADDSNASTCSLRDAVTYLNIPAATRPASHGNGCAREGEATTANIITLPYKAAAYVIDAGKGPIDIDTSIVINGEESTAKVPASPFVWVKASQGFRMDGPPLTENLGSVDAQLDMDPASDTGTVGDRHTSTVLPYFTGTTVVGGTLVCLYAKGPATDAKNLLINTVLSDPVGAWNLRSSVPFDTGINVVSVVTGGATCTAELASTVTPDRVIKVSVYEESVVKFSMVDFVGCGASSLPAHMVSASVVPTACSAPVAGSKGGVFYTNETLELESVAVRGGSADRGGIIYVGDEGILNAASAALLNGHANSGSAIYLERNGLLLSRALIAENRNATEAVMIASGSLVSGFSSSNIENVTFHGNDGFALAVNENVKLNALTIIDNVAGAISFSGTDLTLAASNVHVYNSVVSGICSGAPAAWPTANAPKFNLANSSCQFVDSSNTASNGNLVAVADADKSCYEDTAGMLCPRDFDDDGVTDFYVPRYLPTLVPGVDPADQFSDLINKGSIGETVSACPGQDQRTSNRGQGGRCDIGAIEFQFINERVNAGDFLVSGRFEQTFAADLIEDSDEELYLPANATSICPVTLPTAPLTGAAESCPWLSQAPSKGVVKLTADRKGYFYQSYSDFHGFDTFRIEVTTTASRLNDYSHPTSRTRGILATISSEPASGAVSEGILDDGGAFDWIGLIGLGALLSHRRIRRGASRA